MPTVWQLHRATGRGWSEKPPREGVGQADACRVSRSLLGRKEGVKKSKTEKFSMCGRQETRKSGVWANLTAEQEREQMRPPTMGRARSHPTVRHVFGKS